MTKYILDFTNMKLTLEVTGHAERSLDEDVNLCCAGISMLVNTAIETIQRYAEIDMVREMHIKNTSGHVELTAKAYEYTETELSTINDMLEAGFDLLKERYPGKITRGEIKN